MATGDTGFHCVVVTPERVVLDRQAEFAALPAWDGEVGIMRARAPLMVKLGIGVMRVKAADGEHELAIDGGFAEMVDNRLSVLTEHAHFAKDLERAEVEQALKDARAMEAHDLAAVAARNAAIARAKAQLKLL
jgi:F-type H+-transporting ATPase subunit epsilon